MARKKKRTRRRPPASRRPAAPRHLLTGLQEAEQLMKKKQWAEARDLLEKLDRRYPRRLEVLTELVNACYDMQDLKGYQAACERLVVVDPNNADAALGLAGAYMSNLRPATAINAFQRFLRRWPGHERAAEVRETVTDLEAALAEELAAWNYPHEEGFQLALEHEKVQILMEQGQYPQARKTAGRLIFRYPEFAPAYNNLSQMHWLQGQLDKAIDAARKVLAFEPDNIHALSNLIHYFCLTGQREEALKYVNPLKESQAPAADKWLKIAEAFGFLGDDESILDAFRQAEAAGELDPPLARPMLYHLAATATLRLGDEEQARRLWKRAVKHWPASESARKSLADLRRPVEKRHIPWYFLLNAWIAPQTLQELVQFTERAARHEDDDRVARAIRSFLNKHPEVVATIPLILDRGDKNGREFALLLARVAETPELMEAAKTFALGQRGPDQMRIETAQILSQAGVLPSGLTRIWIDGEWEELLLLGFEISGEPKLKHSPKITRWSLQATEALQERKPRRAERLLNRALAEKPDAPDLLNNLAIAYQMQGRIAEGETIVREIHKKHPDYFFARISMARMAIKDGDLERARELLAPIMHLKKMHFSEFDVFCAVHIELFLAEKDVEGARTWLKLWESADPDNPKLAPYRREIRRPTLRGLRRRLSRKRRQG